MIRSNRMSINLKAVNPTVAIHQVHCLVWIVVLRGMTIAAIHNLVWIIVALVLDRLDMALLRFWLEQAQVFRDLKLARSVMEYVPRG